MNICVDGIGLSMLQGTSLYSYTYEFLNNLFARYPELECQIIWDNPIYSSPLEKMNNLSYFNLNLSRHKNDYSKLEQHIKNEKVQIYHSINNGFSIPFNKECKNISTVYDLLPIINMAYTDKKYYEKFMTVFPNAIDKSDKIIAVSNFIKNQIIEQFNVNEDRIEVIYPGCSNYFQHIDYGLCKNILKDNYNITEDFLLYVGSIHPRKNLHTLFKVFKRLKEYNYTKNMKLVIIGKYDGKREEYYSKLKILAEFLNIEDSIIFKGAVDYKNMPYFYNAAQCLINLSEYDGFSLSVLEAMACKTPVICNNNLLFREVVGDGGILVDINDEVYMKDTILEMLLNDNYRNNVAEAGKRQSEIYKWNTAVEKTVHLYKKVIN
ncbi:glycosyltransferase family 4 protein [Clostridium ganghwense]|uniref:Glycosyltransferase family 1 protein n=1 Tax=Clostridium ganghwense TaxID=312089 RepID=A0ABT4CKF4_9CLOT|nr:glycosyltransferase family 1 protein [Clostridium ganghwense]MCY6369530.1 glycosyltransferase family 1 protein [Clostridium ganghwense]